MVRAFRTVTLEVTPRLAEKISVAQTLGTLSLVLRSIADNQTELERALASGAVDLPDDASKEDEERLLRQAVARPQDGATTFVTGGDVSRFEPRLVKSKQETPPPPAPPVVRVSRGNSTSTTPVGRGASVLVDRQAQGMSSAASVAPLGMSTLR